ncbi:Protein angel 1 [Mortierella sp. NVP41]|nr:Protein angel 1 [Mortierella sp. NVP41]
MTANRNHGPFKGFTNFSSYHPPARSSEPTTRPQGGSVHTLSTNRNLHQHSQLPTRSSIDQPIVIDDDDDNGQSPQRSQTKRSIGEPVHFENDYDDDDQNHQKKQKKKLTPRKWSTLADDRYDSFTVMCYNLLSDNLALMNMHLYAKCKKNDIQWKNRSEKLLAELQSEKMDIYCLQEIDKYHYVHLFQPTFHKWGYSGVYKKRNGNKTDGCAIFFKNKRVKAVKLLGVDYDENAFIKKENVGIVAIFDIKHVLCGDFNALPYSTVIRYLTDESVDVTALPDWRLSGQVQHEPCEFSPPYTNNIAEFHEAFSENINLATPTPTAVAAMAGSASTTSPAHTRTDTSTTETMTLAATEATMQAWSASSLRSLIKRSKTEWDDSSNSSATTTTTSTIASCTNTTPTMSSSSNTHIRFTNSATNIHAKTATSTPTTHTSLPGAIISQPFVLKSAYPFFPGEEVARRNGSNRAPDGAPWTTFHSGGKLVCDYVFYGHLRDGTTMTQTTPSGVSSKRDITPAQRKLKVDGILELPCRKLRHIPSLPAKEWGSDHLSLAVRFRFV